MIVLDCESRESALESLAAVYEISKQEIGRFLQGTDIDEHFRATDPANPADRELTLLFEREFGLRPKPLDKVFWFHLTRGPR